MIDSLLSEVIEPYTFDDIHGMYMNLYPDEYTLHASAIESAYKRIQDSADIIDSDYVIHISLTNEISEEWENVYGVKDDDDERYVLSYEPWADWLGMRISKHTLNTYTPAQIITYCFHEMTIHGYEEDHIKLKRYHKLKEASVGEKLLSPMGKEIDYQMIDIEEEGLADLRDQLKYEIKSSSESMK